MSDALDTVRGARLDARVRRARATRILVLVFGASLALVARRGRATVEEQRARLPPPASCPDAVAGDWLGHTYWPRQGEWYLIELRIRRAAPDSEAITGEMSVHFWDGQLADPQPPAACDPGGRDRTVVEPATGLFANGRVRLDATAWHYSVIRCGYPGGYNLDHYSGVIDPALQEFQSVNNDGHLAVNDPVVFRRVRCPPSSTVADVHVAPPPFLPPRHREGCGAGP